jgi:hypothetical protein
MAISQGMNRQKNPDAAQLQFSISMASKYFYTCQLFEIFRCMLLKLWRRQTSDGSRIEKRLFSPLPLFLPTGIRAPHIMLRDLLTQKFVKKKRLLILDTLEHVDSEKPNRQIDSAPPPPPLYQLFSKWDFYFIKFAKISKN